MFVSRENIGSAGLKSKMLDFEDSTTRHVSYFFFAVFRYEVNKDISQFFGKRVYLLQN